MEKGKAKYIFHIICNVFTSGKIEWENMNMLFLLWVFAQLLKEFGGCYEIDIKSLLATKSLDFNDELFMTMTGVKTREAIYFPFLTPSRAKNLSAFTYILKQMMVQTLNCTYNFTFIILAKKIP